MNNPTTGTTTPEQAARLLFDAAKKASKKQRDWPHSHQDWCAECNKYVPNMGARTRCPKCGGAL